MSRLSLIPLFLIISLPASALAEDTHDHHDHSHGGGQTGFYGHLDARILFDHVYKAAEADEEINEVYTHSHFEVGYGFGNGISINSNIQLEGEPAGHDHGGGGNAPDGSNRYFEDTPLFVRSLTANYDSEYFGGYVGKFDPVLGFGEHDLPGIYGYQIVDDYIVREKIGIGGYGKLHAGNYGTHRLDVSTFFADTTFLSNSILYERGRTRKSDGGVSNTEDFSSVAVALSGSDFYSLSSNIPEGLSYRLGYARQAAGEGDDTAENRYSIGGQYRHIFNADWSGRVLAEIVHINHLNGEEPHDRTYNTAGAELSYGPWTFGSTYTFVNNSNPVEPDEAQNGRIFQASLAYTFDIGISVGAGYKYQLEEGEKNHRIGAMLGYSAEF